MKTTKKLLFIIFLVVIVFVGFVLLFKSPTQPLAIQINQAEVLIEIAGSATSRAQGLSGRESLGEKQGMFFIFEEAELHSFWMKDMLFSLDIIWIDKDFKIVDIDRNITPESFPMLFQPSSPVNYVLEVNAGWTEKNNVRVGDRIEFPISP